MPSVGDGKLKMSKWIPCLEAEVMWYTVLREYAQVIYRLADQETQQVFISN